MLAEHGVGLSATIHPSVLRAVTHLDVDDDDIDAALEAIRARSVFVSAPEPLRDELARLVRTAQAEQRLPSVSATVFRGDEKLWEDAVGLADVEAKRRGDA